MDHREGSHHSDFQEGVTQSQRVLLNAVVAAFQTLIGGIVLFFLYRYLLRSIGEEDLGVWALVLATTSAAGLANLGIATSTVKFVSQAIAQGDPARADRIVQTSAISVAIILGVVLSLLFPLLQRLLEYLIEPAAKIPSGLLILPYALFSFWFNAVAGVFQSCIDGMHRVDLRGYLLIAASLIYLAFVFWLVPVNGLEGLAQAQVIQGGILLVGSWIILKRLLPSLPVLPFRWTSSTFREILGYSLNFQVIAISQVLLLPVAKALMSRFAGVGTLAYFEMAQRMVFQLRALIASAHQAIVPTISALQERSPEKLASIYNRSFKLLVYFVLFALPLFITATPFISYLWIGEYNDWFIFFSVLIFAGWFLNLLANPAYFTNLGTGDLRWNVIGHLVMGGLCGLLGLVMGSYFGGAGVAVGFVAAILIGSSLIPIAYHRKHEGTMSDLFSKHDVFLGIAASIGMIFALWLFGFLRASWDVLPLSLVCLSIFAGATAIPLWQHPVRSEVVDWLGKLTSYSSRTSSS